MFLETWCGNLSIGGLPSPARKKDVPGVLKHVGQQPYNFSSANVESDLDVYMYTNTYIKIRVCVVMFEV